MGKLYYRKEAIEELPVPERELAANLDAGLMK